MGKPAAPKEGGCLRGRGKRHPDQGAVCSVECTLAAAYERSFYVPTSIRSKLRAESKLGAFRVPILTLPSTALIGPPWHPEFRVRRLAGLARPFLSSDSVSSNST